MSTEYCAYPSLKEESYLYGYEIATDRLASMLSVARHHTRHIPQENPLQLTEIIYHVNGPIRGAYAIGEAELKRPNTFYVCYCIEMDRFVSPDGCISASHLHVLRAGVETVICTVHQTQCEGRPVEAILFDFMNLSSNIFSIICLYESAQDGIREREFISRSYV